MASKNYPELEMLSKNLSYEGNYHRKIYYSKLVYDRVRQRKLALTGWPDVDLAFNTSFNYSRELCRGLSSSDSLPDLLPLSTSNISEHDGSATVQLDDAEIHKLLRRRNSTENCSFESFERVSIKPFLGGSETPPSLPPSSPVGSVDAEDLLSVGAGSTDTDESELWDIFQGKTRRRSSSLKSRDSSKSTDRARKKSVRFADVMGLDLNSVKLIMNKDEPPVLPRTVLRDLKIGLEEAHRTEGTRYMCALFTHPGVACDFLERVETRKIALEKCLVDDHDRTVTGTIRVADVCFNKAVTVRYTMNNWVMFNDIAASYVLNSNDSGTDKFAFSITMPMSMTVGNRLEFALKFAALDLGQTYWDNNFSENYQIICYAKAIPTHKSDSEWMHFL